MFFAKSIEQIDRELRGCVQRRNDHKREISKHSGMVIQETRDIDRLLAERHAATLPQIPDTVEGAELPPRPDPPLVKTQ